MVGFNKLDLNIVKNDVKYTPKYSMLFFYYMETPKISFKKICFLGGPGQTQYCRAAKI